jgi:UDP-N-acetyl-D-glucosamine dehydrogenase
MEIIGQSSEPAQPHGSAREVDTARCLERRILSRQAKIGIIGLGYVGLTLAVALAEASYDVLGFDTDGQRVTQINRGKSPISDIPSETLRTLIDEGRFYATDELGRLVEVDAISICVPTPLNKTRDPDISQVITAAEMVASSLKRGHLVILESTTYPGTTREVVLPRLQESELRVGVDFFLAFSPERIDPGNQTYGFRNTPKVVGGIDANSTRLATILYEQVIDSVVSTSTPEAAEMVKLLENTFRSVNIALANETALMCDRLDLDVWEIINAASTKPFGFMPFYPGPGIGGHCIPLDPFYLSWKMKTLNYRARLIELSSEINAEMPHHVVAKVIHGLNQRKKSVNGSNIFVMGVAYKANVGDVRESPALDIIGLLQRLGGQVTYSDPFVPHIDTQYGSLSSKSLTAERLKRADCVVVVTDHRVFDYELVARVADLIVDTRDSIAPLRDRDALLIKL